MFRVIHIYKCIRCREKLIRQIGTMQLQTSIIEEEKNVNQIDSFFSIESMATAKESILPRRQRTFFYGCKKRA